MRGFYLGMQAPVSCIRTAAGLHRCNVADGAVRDWLLLASISEELATAILRDYARPTDFVRAFMHPSALADEMLVISQRNVKIWILPIPRSTHSCEF